MARLIGPVLLETALLCGPGLQMHAQGMTYHLEHTQVSSRFSPRQRLTLAKLNHVDPGRLAGLRQMIVPNSWEDDELVYSPMPRTIPAFASEKKAILVDLAAQAFGAYESGDLVRWGPVSSGDRQHQTPAGIYHLNWQSPVRVSSENPTWIMHWYFNFSSGAGLALHQYTMPGRPASHGCVRLLEVDAKWVYRWGEGWTLDPDTREMIQPGTLVVLVGKYRFAAPKPWLNPKWWAAGVSVEGLPAESTDGAR
jgi:lipoprotein-anchoring transpeptidase ErfK/SrfK